MPKVIFLAHEQLCPEGLTVNAEPGDNLLEIALENDIRVEHACEKSCACTTCHLIVREGYNSLEQPTDTEDDLLDKAWGLTMTSRLSCQVFVGDKDLVVEIPKYTINHAREEH